MTRHEPALCTLSSCQRCDDYGEGYASGKSKAYHDVEMEGGTHAYECGCEPCRIVRGILASAGVNKL